MTCKEYKEFNRTKLDSIKKQIAKLEKMIERIPDLEEKYSFLCGELQENMRDQNRQYSFISNILKTKHDTAWNILNNIR